MDLTLTHAFVHVPDQDAALAFYTDVLGLEKRDDVDMGFMRWLSVGPKSQPDMQLVLLHPGGPFNDQADIDATLALVAKGMMPGIIFATDDVDAAFEAIVAAGAEVTQEPIDQPYGVRDCGFRDPFGNHVRMSSRATS